MDDGRAASDAVMASSGAHHARVTRNSESRTSNRPREASFLFASFSLDAQRERRFNNSKNIFQPNRSDEPRQRGLVLRARSYKKREQRNFITRENF